MAQELIDGMTTSWDPSKYKDTYYDDIMKRVKAKIKAGKSHTIDDSIEKNREDRALRLSTCYPYCAKV